MPPLPTPEEIGAALKMPASRPLGARIGTYAPDQEAIGNFGMPPAPPNANRAFDRTAERLRMLTEATNANAYIYARLIGIRPRYQSDLDFATIAQRYQDESNRIVENGLSLVSNDRLRNRVQDDVAAPLAQERAAIKDQAFRGAADAHATNREDFLQGLVQNLTLNPRDAVTTGGIDAYHAMVDNAVDHGFLTPGGASAEKRRAGLALCAGEYAAMARRDPARARHELEFPEDGHPLLVLLPKEQKDALIGQARERQESNLKDVEDGAFRSEREAQRASNQAESEIVKNLTSEKPTLTRNEILDNQRLSDTAKADMLAIADRAAKPDPAELTSNSTARELLDRIRLSDGNPSKIDNLKPIHDAYIGGKLNKRDFDFVRKEFFDSRLPEQTDLLMRKQSFLKGFEGMIDQSDPQAGKIDRIGKTQMYLLERDLNRKIEQYRKDGKSPFDLFDPSKPDYVGKPQALQPFAHESLRQSFEHRMAELTSAARASTEDAQREASQQELASARTAIRQGADHRAVIDRFNAHGIDFSAL
jgi:hypothetical protein